jgi:hypothetical protein
VSFDKKLFEIQIDKEKDGRLDWDLSDWPWCSLAFPTFDSFGLTMLDFIRNLHRAKSSRFSRTANIHPVLRISPFGLQRMAPFIKMTFTNWSELSREI